MDLNPFLLWLPLSLFLLYFFLQTTKRFPSKTQLPPGPTPLPIVGSILELGDKPHRALAGLSKKHGHIMSLKLGQITTIVLSTPEAAKEALQKHDNSLSARSIPDAIQILGHHEESVIWMPPSQYWKNLRTIIKTHLFTPQKLDANHHIRKSKVRQLVEHVRERTGQVVDIGRAAFGTSLNLISRTMYSADMMDLDSDSSHEFRDLVWGVMEEVGSPNLADFFPLLRAIDPHGNRRRVTKHFRKLFSLFDEIIDRKLQENSGASDLLDELLRLKLDSRTIRTLLADFFIAGSHTSSGTVEWAMAELLRNPQEMERAQAELDAVVGPRREVEESDIPRLPFLRAVVKETFRLHPVVPLLLPHRAETDVELGGYCIPKHSRVLVNVWAIGRDEKTWKDAKRFMPERFLEGEVDFRGRHFELLPFGSGRRMCPGLPLAHRMVHLMLASLLHSFKWRLPDGVAPADIDLTEKFGVTLALATPLPAIPVPAN